MAEVPPPATVYKVQGSGFRGEEKGGGGASPPTVQGGGERGRGFRGEEKEGSEDPRPHRAEGLLEWACVRANRLLSHVRACGARAWEEERVGLNPKP